MGGKPALATGEMMDFETIMVKKEDHVATLTLNRPEVMNAVDFKMFEELKAALDDINEDDDIRVMILTGAGKAFCASRQNDNDVIRHRSALLRGRMRRFAAPAAATRKARCRGTLACL